MLIQHREFPMERTPGIIERTGRKAGTDPTPTGFTIVDKDSRCFGPVANRIVANKVRNNECIDFATTTTTKDSSFHKSYKRTDRNPNPGSRSSFYLYLYVCFLFPCSCSGWMMLMMPEKKSATVDHHTRTNRRTRDCVGWSLPDTGHS